MHGRRADFWNPEVAHRIDERLAPIRADGPDRRARFVMTLLALGAIVEASDTITELLAGHCRESFAGDRAVRAAVLGRIATIGAAAAQLPEPFREAHPEVPWAELATWRSLRPTAGDDADWPAVGRAAAQRLPELGETLAGLLAAERTGVRDH